VPLLDDDWIALLTRANAGDGGAYAAFLRAVLPFVRGVVRQRGRGLAPDQCEDIVQDVLLALHLKRQTWRTGSPVKPWLAAITRHKVIDAFRARGMPHDDVSDFADILPAPAGPDPTDARDAARLIGMLDSRSAGIVTAIGQDGEAVDQVAGRLGMTAGAVRVALHRALRRLSELRREHVE
jgi:RNA polymerase sigma factor (sigma-70 family)